MSICELCEQQAATHIFKKLWTRQRLSNNGSPEEQLYVLANDGELTPEREESILLCNSCANIRFTGNNKFGHPTEVAWTVWEDSKPREYNTESNYN